MQGLTWCHARNSRPVNERRIWRISALGQNATSLSRKLTQREEKRHLSLYKGLEADVALDRVGPLLTPGLDCLLPLAAKIFLDCVAHQARRMHRFTFRLDTEPDLTVRRVANILHFARPAIAAILEIRCSDVLKYTAGIWPCLPYEARKRRSNLIRTVFLNEMYAPNGYFLLVWQGATEFACPSDQQRPGLGVEEQLRQWSLQNPLPVIFDDFHHVGRFTGDRELARPDKRRPARLRINKRTTICVHFSPAQRADDKPRQKNLNEGILLEDHALTFLGTQIAKDRRPAGGKVFPIARLDN